VYCDGTTLNVQHSTILNPYPQTADIFCNTGGGTGGACDNQLTVNNSLLAGGGYLFYPCGNASSAGSSSVTITNNHFARCTTMPTITNAYGGNGQTCTGGGCSSNCGNVTLQTPDANGYYTRGGYFGVDSGIFCSATT